jgi:hypothetical protein
MTDAPAETVMPTGVTADLVQLDQIFDDARSKRNVVIEMLGPVIEKLTINTSEARQTEVQMQLINTYLATIGANEAAAGRRVSSKLKQVDSNAANKHSEAVAELLERVTVGSVRLGTMTERPTAEQSEARIEQAFADNGLDPVLDTELRTDHKDVSS